MQFDADTKAPYVEVATGDQEFERRDISLGISDGIYVEVKEGLGASDGVKVWNQVRQDEFAQN